MPRLPGHAVGLALLLLAISASALSACGKDGSGANGRELTVVATTTQVGDLVRQVGGDRVDVEQILTSGADPHDYEPRPSDAAALAGAAVVFKSGGDLDGWLDGLIDSAGSDAEVVELSDSVEKLGSDPHWWQNPRNAIRAVSHDPPRADRGRPSRTAESTPENAAAYTKKLRAPRRPDRRLHRARAGGEAQARDHPRRAGVLRRPLRHRGPSAR